MEQKVTTLIPPACHFVRLNSRRSLRNQESASSGNHGTEGHNPYSPCLSFRSTEFTPKPAKSGIHSPGTVTSAKNKFLLSQEIEAVLPDRIKKNLIIELQEYHISPSPTANHNSLTTTH
ncbi:Uncharacterized protein dnm_006550 [Desulfonema magnum]|uniref:Uncharacterized protein n=1 Tax=Desulfonema magnum TaxID=45655 RepID=A0A975GKF6_9BACT|nr:Uncharacterized protein dnm_006550 [Desulfonema magnum]